MSAEQMARMEDMRAGRTIPAWRYESVYWLVAAALIGIQFVPDDSWWDLPVILAVMITYGILIRPYRRRAIR